MLRVCSPHPRTYISNHILRMSYFITPVLPTKEDIKALTCPCRKSVARGEYTIFLAL